MTVIYDKDLIAVLKGAEALARQLAPRYAWLFAEQAKPQPAAVVAPDARTGEERGAA